MPVPRASSTRSSQPVGRRVPGAARSSSDSSGSGCVPRRAARRRARSRTGRCRSSGFSGESAGCSPKMPPAGSARLAGMARSGRSVSVVGIADGRDDREGVPAAVHGQQHQHIAGVRRGVGSESNARSERRDAATAAVPVAASIRRRVSPARDSAQHAASSGSAASGLRRGAGVRLIARSSSGR